MAVGAPLPVPQASANLATMWAFLKEGLDDIMQQKAVSYDKYQSLYAVVFSYYTRRVTRMQESSSRSVTFGAQNLYHNLIQYFVTHSTGLWVETDALQDEALLRSYAEKWDRYSTGANHVSRLFSYLNRNWVNRERDEGRKEVYPVHALALLQWKNNIFVPLQEKQTNLTSIILGLVEAQRNGDTIDEGLVKKIIDSFVSLGLDDTNIDKPCLDIYKEHFELPFIDATEKYYRQESESFLATNSLSDYLKKVEGRLREEEDGVERYLNTQTRKGLISKCEHVLIREHSEKMRESFQSLLDSDKDEDLQRICSLLSRIPECLEPLCKKFEEDVKMAGLVAVSKFVGESDAGVDALDLKAYVDVLLDVRQKNIETISKRFKGAAGFVASLDKACREIVNRNAATGASNSKSPELIAKYIDLILRKNNNLTEESDLEDALNRVTILIKYIEDKEVFQTIYISKLSRRLIYGVSASDKSEATMVSNLEEACGFEYANKLRRMFTDTSLSKDLTDQFMTRQMEKNHDGVDISFTIMVLGTHFWPLHPPTHEFLIPAEILPTYDRFQKYYQMKHAGRKLTWLWNYSKNELRTNYLNRKYILKTSTFQMAILLQYNKNDTRSLSELSAATSIPEDYLARVLAILVNAKILINEETDKYNLNQGFRSKNIRVNLNFPITFETKTESTGDLKTVDEGRKYVIRAAIVRIMKARKTMESQPLIQEVISQLSERFVPKVPDIKKAIDTLLESENIERVNGTRNMFAYMA